MTDRPDYLLRDCGFEILDLLLEWVRRRPSEELWRARKTEGRGV
jgi:hypothetical protein